MGWINKHWDSDYITMAKTKIREMVSLFIWGYVKLFLHTPYKMLEYCKKAPKAEPSILGDPARPGDQEHPFMALASQYGLPAKMIICAINSNKQTVDEEYQAYVMM